MKKEFTLTDILLAGALIVSLLTALLHPVVPAAVCAAVHIAVTVYVSAVHLKQPAKEAQIATINA